MKLNDERVRCLLVRPEFQDNTFYNPRDMFLTLGARSAAPPLGLLTVAAMLPAQWILKFVDGDTEPVTDQHLAWAQVLMISGKGSQQPAIERLMTRAHAFGVRVVVGGAGPTLQPDFYLDKADYIVAGEAEPVMSRLLADIVSGTSAGIYRGVGSADIEASPVPRYDLANLDQYLFVGMNFTRGCPFSCEFCAQIEIFGRTPRCKSVTQILAEHQRLYDLGYRGMIDFGYDNLIGDIAKAEQVLTAMLEWNRERDHPYYYSTEATMNLARQPRILELMRDNDFRFVFMGIESGDHAVLARAHKGQNTSMTADRAVQVLNSYGIVVNTGLILGFDGENDQTAERMLEMVQRSGAFPTLVLPLHALPNTALARRLAGEGRLFQGGIVMNAEDRSDTATTGLNFVTDRPRAAILRDLANVLEQLYTPEAHSARIKLTTRQLVASRKHRPPLRKVVHLARSFVGIVRALGAESETALPFWTALLRAALTNPVALETVVAQSVMNANYAKQTRSYVRALRQQIEQVDEMTEPAFNLAMGARPPGWERMVAN